MSKLISKIFGLEFDNKFYKLGLSNSKIVNTLSYVCEEKYIDQVNDNENIVAVITTKEISYKISKKTYVCDDPLFAFWEYFNVCSNHIISVRRSASNIHESCSIHPTSYICHQDVTIGKNSIIEPNVTIHGGVCIGEDCLVRSGAVLGFDGFEMKKTDSGILPIIHDGLLVINDRVEIGSLNSVAKGFSWQNTYIDCDTKLDSLVHIGHASKIGKACLITASCEISGSVVIDDNCWLGPRSAITNGVTIGPNTFIGIGAVVTKSFGENLVIAGNPAKILRRK
jgi:UDP-3-O-[3-hydroxymyristoyl] glucosamine N-acyltransferase